MKSTTRAVLAVFLATIWISISEFVRNEALLKSYWVEHYQALGLDFPDEPINGAVWGLWSLCFALGIYAISRGFGFWESTIISWFMGFVLMWIVTANMSVLPYAILIFAVPLSLLEAAVAVWMIKKLTET